MPPPLLAALTMAVTMLGAGGMITLILRARHLYGGGLRGGPFGRRETNENDVKLAALNLHQKLAQEKLDVLKRAIDLGWDDQQLKQLDARLEQLVGKDEVGKIASGSVMPSSDLESMALSPERELERMKKQANS